MSLEDYLYRATAAGDQVAAGMRAHADEVEAALEGVAEALLPLARIYLAIGVEPSQVVGSITGMACETVDLLRFGGSL